MSVLIRLLPENPVLTKEMRVRMRGARAYWILLGYLGFLSVVLLFTYYNWQNDVRMNGSGASESSRMGGNIFLTLLICQAFLVLFITPAITSGSITIEKEQQTLDMLAMTRLSRASMVAGKLLSAVSFTALLLISSLPLVSICFMLGGVDPAMVFSTYLAMLMGSFLIGAVGLMWSSVARTTTVAVLLTYLTMLAFSVIMAYTLFLYYGLKANPMGIGGAMNAPVFALLSIAESWCSPGFPGLPNVEYLGFVVVSLVAGILMAAIAMARLETWPDRRAGILRGLTALLILLQVTACNIWWLNRLYGFQAITVANIPAIGALCVPLLLLMLIVPTFTTGEVIPIEARKFGKYLLWGWTPKGLMRGKLASGIPFLIVLTLLCIGAYAMTFVCFGKARDILTSGALPGSAVAPPAPVLLAQAAPPGYTGTIVTHGTTTVYQNGQIVSLNGRRIARPAAPAPTPKPVVAQRSGFWDGAGGFLQAVILLLAFVIGFGLLCQFLSIAFNNRWVAWTLAYLVLFVIIVFPWLSAVMIDNGTEWMTVNLAYLNPFFGFVELTDPNNTWASQHLVLGAFPLWLSTSVLWTLIGCLSFLATLPFVARVAMISKPIPYEEMVTSV